jgi:hypothetical protein
LFRNLPVEAQQDAIRAYRLFQTNPSHPGLQFKKLEGQTDLYSIRIGMGYRTLALLKKDGIVWFWIGTHAEYDRLV